MIPSTSPSAVIPTQAKAKLTYIDNLKVVLTVLVILHHAFITYGAPGGWYFTEKTTLTAALIPMTAFVAVNQSFFMGFFFFLSALFIPSSYDKKGPAKFTVDRLVRLGLPLLFYSFVLSPFLSFMPYNYTGAHPQITYLQYLSGFESWIDFGVLWFVAALLLFTLLYVGARLMSKAIVKRVGTPSTKQIILFALGIGIITYFVRIKFPIGWVLHPVGFQFAHFPQYIAMFVLGLLASRSKWTDNVNPKVGKQTLRIALALVLLGFPALLVAQVVFKFPLSDFGSGGHWPSLGYAVWEQLTGFSIIAVLMSLGKHRWNQAPGWLVKLSRCTFAVYIFHPLVLIALSVLLHSWAIEPALKLLVVGPLAVLGSFALGMLLVKVPVINKVI